VATVAMRPRTGRAGGQDVVVHGVGAAGVAIPHLDDHAGAERIWGHLARFGEDDDT
jgi:hypothetical protein